MSLLEANLKIFKLRFPQVVRELKDVSFSNVEIVYSKIGLPTFYYNFGSTKILFYSIYDPIKEVKDFLKDQDFTGITTLFLFGLGFGYHLSEIKNNFSGPIFVFEPSLEILKVALETVDLASAIDERIFILTKAEDIEKILKLYLSLQKKGLENIKVLVLPRYRIFSECFKGILDLLKDFIYTPITTIDFSEKSLLKDILDFYLKRLRKSCYLDLDAFNCICLISDITNFYSYKVNLLFEHAFYLYEKKDYSTSLEAFSMAWCMDAIKLGCINYQNKDLVLKTATCYENIAQNYKFNISIDKSNFKNKEQKINLAHITSQFVDDTNSPTQLLKTFVKYHNYKIFNVFIYSSELSCKRENPRYPISIFTDSSKKRAPKFLNFLKENNVPVYLAPLDSDYIDTAICLAKKIVEDKIDIIFFHASMFSAVEAMLCNWKLATVNINLDMGSFMYCKNLDAVTYFVPSTYRRDLEFWKKNRISSYLMPSGYDFEERIKNSEKIMRQDLNFSEDDILLITIGNHLEERISLQFLKLIVEFLKNEKVFWLIIGPGEFFLQKNFLSNENVLNKVIFLGSKKNVFSYLKISDIYLNEFPQGGGQSVAEAMACGLAVVAMYSGEGHLESCGANLVGEQFAVKSEKEYRDFLLSLINDSSKRKEIGLKMKKRFEEKFSAPVMVKAFEDLALKIYEKKLVLSNVTE